MQAELLRKTIYNFPGRYGQDSTPSGAEVLPSLPGLLRTAETGVRPWQGGWGSAPWGNILLCIVLSREQTSRKVKWRTRPTLAFTPDTS